MEELTSAFTRLSGSFARLNKLVLIDTGETTRYIINQENFTLPGGIFQARVQAALDHARTKWEAAENIDDLATLDQMLEEQPTFDKVILQREGYFTIATINGVEYTYTDHNLIKEFVGKTLEFLESLNEQ